MHIITPIEFTVAIWNKTKGKCWYCGENIGKVENGNHKKKYVVDHVIPKRKGGTDSFENLVPCCSSCNNSKNNTHIEIFRLRLALKKMGSPAFNIHQILWLLKNMNIPYYKFYGEEITNKKYLDLTEYKNLLSDNIKEKITT